MLKINEVYFLDADTYNVILGKIVHRKRKDESRYTDYEHLGYHSSIRAALLSYLDVATRDSLKADIDVKALLLRIESVREDINRLYGKISKEML